jgi:hypothetical protein
MNNVASILASLPWFAWIAIAAIFGETIRSVTRMILRHHERIEMIRQGMNPDAVHAKPKEFSEV